jgi:hypothetical protein
MSTAAVETEKKMTLGDAARVSELKELGWNLVQAEDKTWSAFEKAGELRKVGPATTIKALHTQVMLAAGPSSGNGKATEARVAEDDSPSSRLPGMEEPAIEELDRLGDDCIDTKEARRQSENRIRRQVRHHASENAGAWPQTLQPPRVQPCYRGHRKARDQEGREC